MLNRIKIFNDIKLILGINTRDHDQLIKFLMDDVINNIVNYTRRDENEIPVTYSTLIVQQVINFYRADNGQASSTFKRVKTSNAETEFFGPTEAVGFAGGSLTYDELFFKKIKPLKKKIYSS